MDPHSLDQLVFKSRLNFIYNQRNWKMRNWEESPCLVCWLRERQRPKLRVSRKPGPESNRRKELGDFIMRRTLIYFNNSAAHNSTESGRAGRGVGDGLSPELGLHTLADLPLLWAQAGRKRRRPHPWSSGKSAGELQRIREQTTCFRFKYLGRKTNMNFMRENCDVFPHSDWEGGRQRYCSELVIFFKRKLRLSLRSMCDKI